MCNYFINCFGNYIRYIQLDVYFNFVYFYVNEDLQVFLDCCSGELEEIEEDDIDIRQVQVGFSDIFVDVEFMQLLLYNNDFDYNENY